MLRVRAWGWLGRPSVAAGFSFPADGPGRKLARRSIPKIVVAHGAAYAPVVVMGGEPESQTREGGAHVPTGAAPERGPVQRVRGEGAAVPQHPAPGRAADAGCDGPRRLPARG